MTVPDKSHDRPRVLLVEDDPDSAESWSILLKMWGYETEIVHDGISALHAAVARPPDAVLIDLGLPCLDGYEVARRLREKAGPRRPLLIALTGRAMPLDRIATSQAGFDLHITKPADPDEVRAALMRLRLRPVPAIPPS